MKNKKGFTLVELLVVIVILGALILLAMPTVLNAMETSSKNIFSSQTLDFAKNIKTAFEVVKSEQGAGTPTCYNVAPLKDGDSYEGCIIMDYENSDVASIHVYNKEFYYDSDYATLADQKGKAVLKFANATASSSYEVANATNCPSTCADPVAILKPTPTP